MAAGKDQEVPEESTQLKQIRLWPGVLIVALQLLARFGTRMVAPEMNGYGMLGGLLGGLFLIVWWAFFSRARRSERWGGVLVIAVSLVATKAITHETIATGGMGIMFFIFVAPPLSLLFVLWAAVSRPLAPGLRFATMVATILVASLPWALIQTGGVTADGISDFSWRWAQTPEERLLAQYLNEPLVPAPAAATFATEDWPGFRGTSRDSIVRGLTILTDWTASPPIELWRRPVGPGWSSFAVGGGLLYTQEQRGDDEAVTCYIVASGKPVWRHYDKVRFWEAQSGAGPRGTPTLSNGRVYSLGATGILNAFDARDGSVVWSRDVASDASVEVPMWAFSSSPLVVDGLVLVAIEGVLAAYDLEDGSPRWSGPNGGRSYSSPHLLTMGGTAQVLLMSEAGARSVLPADGTTVWEYSWSGERIVQPALTADGDLLLSAGGGGKGMRRVSVTRGEGGWQVEERWKSRGIKPYFNDFVIHKGHAFGFVGRALACIDVKDGTRKWKGDNYGGQLVLLADQDMLLIVSESGELALVDASPDKFNELSRIPGIAGKTWNHPALVGDVLLVRNAEEMAAFRLPIDSGGE